MEQTTTTRGARRLVGCLVGLVLVLSAWPIVAQETPREMRRRKLMERRKRTIEMLEQRREAARAEKKRLREEFSIYKIETFNENGDASRRLDIVFLSEGFDKNDYKDFTRASETVARHILGEDPFKSYRDYTNLHRVFVASDDSGITSPGKTRKTVFGGHVDENGILLVNNETARRYAEFVSDCDLLVVVCNIRKARSTASWGGRGAPVVALATDQWGGHAGSTLIHELGHAFGHLADEYVDPVMSARVNGEKPTEEVRWPNVSVSTDPDRIKWHYWLGTSGGSGGKVGAYRGAHYHPNWYVRPQKHCIMRCDSKKFCAVCMEQMIRRYYQYIDPIDSATPHEVDQVIFSDDRLTLEADLVRVRGKGKADAEWFVDGQSRPGRDRLTVQGRRLGPGLHQVLLYARYKDPRVRRDLGLLSSSRAWRVRVLEQRRPTLVVDDNLRVGQGEKVTLPVRVDGKLTDDYTLAMVDLPEGATFDTEAGLAWTVPKTFRGTMLPRLVLRGPHGVTVEQPIRITVRGNAPLAPESPANTPPVYDREAEVEIDEGQALEMELTAFDADGDSLVYTCNQLPEGMTFDAHTGAINWPTGFASGGVYKLNLQVSDGLSRAAVMRLTVTVNDRGITGPDPLKRLAEQCDRRPTHDLHLVLRSAYPRVRTLLLDLAEARYPSDLVFAELFRLSRDPHPQVAREAFERLVKRMSADHPDRRRNHLLLVELVGGHLDDFMDAPDRLASIGTWLEEADKMDFDPRTRPKLGSLKSTFDKIVRHNKKRGLATD